MNILIVGFGNFGKKYITLLNENYKNFKLYLLRHSKKNEDLKKYNISKIFYSLEETNIINLDIVIITNPSCYHVDTANYFIKKNIHCLIEKPIDSTYSKALSIINNNNCCIEIGYLLRHSKLYHYLIDCEKYVGKIIMIKINVGQYLPNWRNIDYRKCVSSSKDKGGGVILELSHDLNYLIGILNTISNSYNYKIKSFYRKGSELEIDVEDICNSILEIEINDKYKINVSINLDMIDFDSNRSCKIIGTEGTLNVDFVNKNVNLFKRNNENKILLSNCHENLLEKQFSYFLSNIKNSNYQNKNLNDAIKTMKLINDIKS